MPRPITPDYINELTELSPVAAVALARDAFDRLHCPTVNLQTKNDILEAFLGSNFFTLVQSRYFDLQCEYTERGRSEFTAAGRSLLWVYEARTPRLIEDPVCTRAIESWIDRFVQQAHLTPLGFREPDLDDTASLLTALAACHGRLDWLEKLDSTGLDCDKHVASALLRTPELAWPHAATPLCYAALFNRTQAFDFLAHREKANLTTVRGSTVNQPDTDILCFITEYCGLDAPILPHAYLSCKGKLTHVVKEHAAQEILKSHVRHHDFGGYPSNALQKLVDSGVYDCIWKEALRYGFRGANVGLVERYVHRINLESRDTVVVGDLWWAVPLKPSQARPGLVKIVDIMLDTGLDVNINDMGETMAHIAADNGHLDVLRLLHSRGADFIRHNRNGESPARLAEEKGHEDCAAFIKSAIAQQHIDRVHHQIPGLQRLEC